MASVTEEKPKVWRRFNWWKIGFFLALFAFEITREWAVLASNEEPKLATLASVSGVGDLTVAEGRWTRIDSGEKLTPNIVRIDCWRNRGECYEMNVSVNDGYVSAPTLGMYEAQFTPDAVTYDNDDAWCTRYSTRIDLRLKKAFSVRTKKDVKDSECDHLDSRIEMQLGSGWQDTDAPLKGHFLPLASLVAAILKLL